MGGMESADAEESAPLNRVEEAWEQWFQDLLACRQPDGSLPALTGGPGSVYGLSTWCMRQRKRYKQGQLSPERVARMEAAGFRWDYDRGMEEWMDMYRELQQFHQEHGHTRLTSTTPGFIRLFAWAQRQRRRHKKGLLAEDRVRLLEALGFPWEEPAPPRAQSAGLHEKKWQAKLAELAAFKERYGRCMVPTDWPKNRKLAVWVRSQMSQRKHGRLSAERVAALEALGFAWDLHAAHQQLEADDSAVKAGAGELPPGWEPPRRGRPPLKRG